MVRWNSHENNHPGLCPPEHVSRAGTTKMDSCSFHLFKYIFISKATWNPHDLIIVVCGVCIMGISSVNFYL